MNDPMIIAGASVIVIGALAAAAINIINAFAKMKTELMEISKRAAVIEGHVNSAATRSEVVKTALENTIADLKANIVKQDEIAISLANAAAIALDKNSVQSSGKK